MSGASLCGTCDSQAKQAVAAAVETYQSLLTQLIADPHKVSEIGPQLAPAAETAELGGESLSSLNQRTMEIYLEQALEDDYLTEAEEAVMNRLAEALGVTQATFETRFSALMPRLFVARCNDGRLPQLPNPRIMLKRGELAHMETNAYLMKEVVHREYRGGYSGVSFRVAKGVRFHTGGTRGKSVVTGSSLEVADQGILTVTSQRSVYTGARRSIEMLHSKVLGLNVFEDGVQFQLSNRQNPPMFRLEKGMGDAVAAAINAACQ
jgi:hypothetical protein